MKNNTRRFVAIVVVGLALMTPIRMAFRKHDVCRHRIFQTIKRPVVAMGTLDSDVR